MMEQEPKFNYIKLGIDISNLVRSTLGPRGMNKMLVNGDEVILTNDGATIMKNTKIENPIGGLFKKLAEGQEKAIGDGTTTALILTGQLLEKAMELLNKNVHQTTIIKGYNLARDKCIEHLIKSQYAGEKEDLILTTFGSKINKKLAIHLASLLKEADRKKLKIFKKKNSDPLSSQIIRGYAFEGYTINERMPIEAEGNVAVLELRSNLEFSKIQASNASDLEDIENKQKEFMRNIADKLEKENVKICFYSDTNPLFENYLTKKGIMSVVAYARDHIDNICLVTGATAIQDPAEEFKESVGLGRCFYDKECATIILKNKGSKIQTLLLGGQTDNTLDETARAVDDVMGILRHDTMVVTGAGSIETELSLMLEEFAKRVGGKEQIAIRKFAEAMESIPLILAENCGLDAIETLTLLKTEHNNGKKTMGVDEQLIISSAEERGIIEPSILKINAINSANDVACIILKLDQILQGGEK